MISDIFCNTCVEVLFNIVDIFVMTYEQCCRKWLIDWLTECYKYKIAKLKYESTMKNWKKDVLIPVCGNSEMTVTKCVENGTK